MHRLGRAAVTATFLLPGLWLGLPAVAHDAPSGWTYPISCCGLQDCSPLEAGDIAFIMTASGPAWRIAATGEVVPADEAQSSPDRMNHRCVYLEGEKAGLTRKTTANGATKWCLWIADGSF